MQSNSDKTSVVLCHPTANSFVRNLLLGFFEADMLAGFHTSIASFPGNIWCQLSRMPGGRDFARRTFVEQLRDVTVQWPVRELGRMFATRLGWSSMIRHETGPLSVDAVYRDLDRKVSQWIATRRLSAVYAYEDGAVKSFQTAAELGIARLYDLPIGHWRAARTLMADEAERWPQYATTLGGFRDSDAKLRRKDEELRLADHVFVASRFTESTLRDHPTLTAPVHVIPYGYPTPGPAKRFDGSPKNPLRLLFVGGLSQRKGIADVLTVADQLSADVVLTVIGRGDLNQCPALSTALPKHRWIATLPHDQILQQMRDHDVLLFPSLFEGFGLVITEAMSQGTPVITTDRTAGPDLITHGHNGWLIPAGSTEALRQQVETLLNDRASIAAIGENARRTAAGRPWSAYGSELAAKVREVLTG